MYNHPGELISNYDNQKNYDNKHLNNKPSGKPKNDKPINQYSKIIMEFMNSDFDGFREAGTAGKEIIMSNNKEIFAKWIIQVYSEKNTKFFISNNFTIIPIESISDFFDISAKYRKVAQEMLVKEDFSS